MRSSPSEEDRSRGFSEDQLQLIFDMRRDIADQQFKQQHINQRLDALFEYLSGEPTPGRCPVCRHPFNIVPTWPH